MFFKIFHLTVFIPLVKPTPKIPPTIAWVVETGIPKAVKIVTAKPPESWAMNAELTLKLVIIDNVSETLLPYREAPKHKKIAPIT